jgi:rhomboid protease GluP
MAVQVDATTRRVWRNRWQMVRTIAERALRAAPVSDSEVQAAVAEQALPVASGRPIGTWGLLAFLAAIFALETALANGSTPRPVDLLALGGINRKLVLAGEWWRAASGTVLHANLNHLVANGISLLIAGSTLEHMVGRAWFGALYVVSALAGALATIAFGSGYLVSVGASGAIMGVVAAATVCGLMRHRRQFGVEAIRLLISVLVPTLGLAVWGGAGAVHIDHFAHFGGAIGGALAAGILLVAWRKADPLPPAKPVAFAIVALGCAALAFAVSQGALRRAAEDPGLVPANAIPSGQPQQARRLAELVSQYPRDPRTHMALGAQQWQDGRQAEAEASFRRALALEHTLTFYFDSRLAVQIRAGLVGVLMDQRKEAEAREEAKPLCRLQPDARELEDWIRTLRRSLCQ